MVDIFEIAPQGGAPRGASSHFAYAGQGARLARYQHLISKLNTEEEASSVDIKVGWLADDDTPEMNRSTAVSLKTLDGDEGAFVGTFADAAAAASTTGTLTAASR
jgi:hypothetical protein